MKFGELQNLVGGATNKGKRGVMAAISVVLALVFAVIAWMSYKSDKYEDWWVKLLFWIAVILAVVLGLKAAYDVVRIVV